MGAGLKQNKFVPTEQLIHNANNNKNFSQMQCMKLD